MTIAHKAYPDERHAAILDFASLPANPRLQIYEQIKQIRA
jgi:hypothetical protein